MKNLLILVFACTLAIAITSCENKDCEVKNEICKETVPTNEACQAAFQRWFYNEEKNACEQIGYSGCSQKGFATKADCEQCECE